MLKLSAFEHVEVYFSPTNVTSQVQPLEANMIAVLKARFKSRMLLRVFKSLDLGSESSYDVDVLAATRWTEVEWKALPSSCIQNCLQHCFKTIKDGSIAFTTQECDIRDEIERDLNASKAQFTTTRIESLLNRDAQNQVAESLQNENQIAFIAGSTLPDTLVYGKEAVPEVYSISGEHKTLAMATFSSERLGYNNDG